MIVTLKDITTKITKGTTPTSIGCKFEKSGINFIKSESLVDGKTIDKSKFAFISERTHERLKRSQIEENDILFSMAGMFLGKTGIATAEVVPANTNQAVAIIRVDDTKANYEYVYYYLNQKSVIHTINMTSAQSAQPNINLKQIGEIKINLPDRKKQDQIVSLLSAIDLKISNNVEINDNFPKKTNNPNPSPIGNKFGLFLFGPSGENRTHGLLNPIQARYQNCATPGYRPPLPYRSVATRDIILRQGRFVNRFFDYFWFFLRKV